MSKTIYYYNCFITRNGIKTNIRLTDLLDSLITIDSQILFKNTKYGNISLIDMKIPDPNSENFQNRTITIGKFRDHKPFLGNKGTRRADEIADDVLELTTAVCIPNSNLIMLEYNHYGCRPIHLQHYLSHFLPSNENESWMVEFIEIEPTLGFNDVRHSQDIKSIEFNLNLMAPTPNAFLENQSLIVDILRPTINSHAAFGANKAKITFSNGRLRREVMHPQRLIELVAALELESEVFESIKVKYRSPTSGNQEYIDLKNAGVLKRFIMHNDDTTGWEYIGDQMELDYYTNNRPGHGFTRRYDHEIIAANLPNLVLPEIILPNAILN
ncbi:hypothetical protein COF41_04385 [Bacillus toyonensis]|uniref:DUF6731 family protein n=1 Tax=Bacillus toyonensis TaxID=155322 RepID=UPI000BF12CFD|nr:DUF6731 family protein [Bacillus toyonensis]MCU5397362.1 hypothetical protein [Bacillus toyonensis]PEM55106.1 hypothetical protein CN625_29850 [Bacillus toyonensis]PHE21479.1 hypothetical protein COF41_04385 [Bacillus toyonensis]